MTKNHGNQIKDDAKHEALRREGASKEKAARIANSPGASKRGGQASQLVARTRLELLDQAKKIGIIGRHRMSKQDLIKAIKGH
ncbi:DUF7218 family protein [Sphingobacterium sp. MYb382]|uniref:DUF7218 family protein n=1 Tax=Sphingobacterium sp. MYb382 TaxID=2745278 RepID=UPI00309E78DA